LSTRTRLLLLAVLLPVVSCVLGADQALTFPTFVEGEASFPSALNLAPVFSGNYGLVASGDTLYYMELRHGRIHGKLPAGGVITGLAASDSRVFVVHDDVLFSADGFEVSASCTLPCEAEAVTLCGDSPVVLLNDGSLVLYNGSDLSPAATCSPDSGIAYIQGFPGILVTGYTDGRLVSLSVPAFSVIAEEQLNGSLVFMAGGGPENLLFSTDEWNEVAVCSPLDLKIQVMFTFSETPASASSDSDMSCIYAVCPDAGIQVCLSNGEIAWRTRDFGRTPMVTVSGDCEQALVAEDRSVTLLLQ